VQDVLQLSGPHLPRVPAEARECCEHQAVQLRVLLEFAGQDQGDAEAA